MVQWVKTFVLQILKTWVQIPGTHVNGERKMKTDSKSPKIWLFGSLKRPCLKVIRQTVTENYTWHPALASTPMHTRTYAHGYTYSHLCTELHTPAPMHTAAHTSMHTATHPHLCTRLHTFTPMHSCTHPHTCMAAHTHTQHMLPPPLHTH